MSYTVSWKILEDLMIELRRKGIDIPPSVVDDLRSAKLMIQLTQSPGSRGDAEIKVEEYLSNAESFLVTAAQENLGSKATDDWLKRLDEAHIQTCEIPTKQEPDKFITGVPRDQKWLRIEPMPTLNSERLLQIAKENKLAVNPQKDGRIVVFGQQDDLKAFLKKMTEESSKK